MRPHGLPAAGEVESLAQKPRHLPRNPHRAAGLPLLLFRRTPDEVRQAELPPRSPDRVAGRKTVAHQCPRKGLAEHLLDHLVAAATANDIQGRLSGDEVPQPGGLRADAPAGLVGADGGAGPNLRLEVQVDRLGPPGQPLAGLGQGAGGQVDSGGRAEEVRHLAEGYAQPMLEVRRQRYRPRADVRAGCAGGRRGLQRVPAADRLAAAGTEASLGIESSDDGLYRRQVGLEDGLIVFDSFDGTAASGQRSRGTRKVSVTASGGGVARKEAVWPGFLPGGFGWVFGFSLASGAAFRFARRNSSRSVRTSACRVLTSACSAATSRLSRTQLGHLAVSAISALSDEHRRS